MPPSRPDSSTTTGRNPAARTNVTTAMGGTYSLTVTRNGSPRLLRCDVAVNVGPTDQYVRPRSAPVLSSTGMSSSLTASSGGTGATYSWTGHNGFFASTRNATVTSVVAASAGIYSLTVTRNGCTTTATTAAVTMARRWLRLPLPLIPTLFAKALPP